MPGENSVFPVKFCAFPPKEVGFTGGGGEISQGAM